MSTKVSTHVLLCFLLIVPSVLAQGEAGRPPKELKFVGDVSRKSDAAMYLWNDAKVIVSTYRGTFRWLGGPSVVVIDAHNGKELIKREIKVRCANDYTFTEWKALPDSTDLVVKGGCDQLLLVDGATLANKRKFTADVRKLWLSRFALSADGKLLALMVASDEGARSVLKLLRTSDWQEEASWQAELSDNPVAFSSDGQRLLLRRSNEYRSYIKILRVPSGEHESDINRDIESAVVPIGAEEILFVEADAVWTIHLADGARERRSVLERWPKPQHVNFALSANGEWLCAPTSAPGTIEAPVFSIWSTRTGRILVSSDVLSPSPEELLSAKTDAFLGEPRGVAPGCQIAPDGKHVMLTAQFGETFSRARIYEVVF